VHREHLKKNSCGGAASIVDDGLLEIEEAIETHL
jgi:hypothetical protein